MNAIRFRRMTAALAAAISLSAWAAAAELPAKAAKAPPAPKGGTPARGLPRCDVGGLQGVMTPAGLCVKLGGSVSAGVWGQSGK